MNRDKAQGCGCLVGLLAGLAALAGAGFFAILAFVSFVGWPIAAALAVLLTISATALVYFAVRFIVAARHRSRTTGPYRAKLTEIDRLVADVEAAILRIAGGDIGGQEIRGRIRELKRRRDAVLSALVEIDEFLRSPANRDFRLRTESTYTRIRERLAGESMKPELAENAARLRDVQSAVAKVKVERQTLIANLDRIAIGLREIRARMLPSAASVVTGEDIAKDLSRLTDAIVTEEKIRRELDAIEAPGDDPTRPRPDPQKLPH